MAGQLTLQAKLDIVTGDSDVLAALRITLCNFGTFIPHITGTSTVAKGQYVAKQTNGTALSVKLWGNDVITPDTTFYCIEVIDSRGVVIQAGNYRLTGTSTLDLSNLLPFLSPAPPPILPPLIVNTLEVISGASNFGFNLSGKYLSYKAILSQNATIDVSNIQPGNLYTFIVVQDSAGLHQVTWAAKLLNAAPVWTRAFATTVQTFVADDQGNLYAIAPGTYYL